MARKPAIALCIVAIFVAAWGGHMLIWSPEPLQRLTGLLLFLLAGFFAVVMYGAYHELSKEDANEPV